MLNETMPKHVMDRLSGRPFTIADNLDGLSIFDARDSVTWVADIMPSGDQRFVVRSWNEDLAQDQPEELADALERLCQVALAQDKMIWELMH